MNKDGRDRFLRIENSNWFCHKLAFRYYLSHATSPRVFWAQRVPLKQVCKYTYCKQAEEEE